MKLGSRIRYWRKRRGLSQAALTEASGVNRRYLSLLENGKNTNPSLDVLDRLADALGIDVTDLLANGDPDRAAVIDLWPRLSPENRGAVRSVAETLANIVYSPSQPRPLVMAEDRPDYAPRPD